MNLKVNPKTLDPKLEVRAEGYLWSPAALDSK